MRTGARSRFVPERPSDLWKPAKDSYLFKNQPFNFLQHELTHSPIVFVYTSKATLDLVISTPWYPPRDYSIQSVKLSVTGTPVATDLVWNVLVGGASIFAENLERPRIKAGDLEGRKTFPSRQSLPEGSKLQCQGITLSAATGPLTITMELLAM